MWNDYKWAEICVVWSEIFAISAAATQDVAKYLLLSLFSSLSADDNDALENV